MRSTDPALVRAQEKVTKAESKVEANQRFALGKKSMVLATAVWLQVRALGSEEGCALGSEAEAVREGVPSAVK